MNSKDPPPPPVWQVEYVVAYFGEKMKHDPDLSAKAILDKLGLAYHGDLFETIQRRLEPFLTPILPRSTVRVNIDNVELQTLGPGSSFGISSSVNRLHFESPHGYCPFTISASNQSSDYLLPSNTILAEPYGWGVISDIDDTMKVTMTPSHLGILKTTFLDEPEACLGMPSLYAHLDSLLSSPTWFYLSASPYNLYPFLREFCRHHYPSGTLILRDASWQNLAGLIASLSVSIQEYKVHRMMKLHG